MADYFVGIEFVSGSFTNVTADVTQASITRILAGTFTAFRPGGATLQLVNDDGRYSPDNPNSQYAGLIRPNLPMKITATDASSTRGLFLGEIDDWSVQPQIGGAATVTARDVGKTLRVRTVTTSLFQDYNVASTFAEVFNAVDVSSYSVDAIKESIPFAWFRDQRADTAINELLKSGFYFAYVDGNGVINVKDRYYDATGTVVSSHNSGWSMSYALTDDEVINDAVVESRERQLVNSTQVLGSVVSPIPVPANSYVNFRTEYLDPQNLAPVPGTQMVTPVASTDYLVNVSSDGSGSDRTSTTSVYTTFFGQTAVNTVYNGTASEVFITKFNLRGKPVQRRPSVSARAQDVSSSQAVYGKKTYQIASEFFQGFEFAQNYATFIVDKEKNPAPDMSFGLVNEFPEILDIDLGSLIHITNSITGVASAYVVAELTHSIDMGRGQRHELGMSLEGRKSADVLILGNNPLGIIGQRKLGF